MANRPTVAVHKFSSCDGCQLAFLNMGAELLTLTQLIEIKHFAEAGPVDETASVDIAFIEGSISTPREAERIRQIRQNSATLITIGACATSGGIQALRNLHNVKEWIQSVYAKPEYIDSLTNVTPIAAHVTVDFEIWGCPISSEQLVAVIRSLLSGVMPTESSEKVCMECKRAQNICTLVTQKQPCLGPVTKAGCGAICPRFGRDCYACYGPARDGNTDALARCLHGLGLQDEEIVRRFRMFNNQAPMFYNIASKLDTDV